jgi:hypothetical protein
MSKFKNMVLVNLDENNIKEYILYCTCGHKTKNSYTCSNCNNTTDDLNVRVARTGAFNFYKLSEKIFETDTHIRLTVLKGGYRYLFHKDRLVYSSSYTRLTYNKKTRNTYYSTQMSHKKKFRKLICISSAPIQMSVQGQFSLINEFLDKCLDSQQLSFKKPITDTEQIYLLKYPALRAIDNLTIDLKSISKSNKKKLQNPNLGGKEVIKIIFGRNEQSLRHFIAEQDISFDINGLIYACKNIQDINVIMRLMRRKNNTGCYLKQDKVKVEAFLILTKYISIKKFFSFTDFTYLADTAYMINRFTDLQEEVPNIKHFKTIEEMHDFLAVEVSKIRRKNHVLEYKSEEKKLETVIEDMTFKLAQDTHELITIGQLMRICVGSYDQKARAKACNIVTVQKNDSYLACLELVPESKTFTLHQAKTKYNSYPTDELKDVIIQWCTINNVHHIDCRDLNPIKMWDEDIAQMIE